MLGKIKLVFSVIGAIVMSIIMISDTDPSTLYSKQVSLKTRTWICFMIQKMDIGLKLKSIRKQ